MLIRASARGHDGDDGDDDKMAARDEVRGGDRRLDDAARSFLVTCALPVQRRPLLVLRADAPCPAACCTWHSAELTFLARAGPINLDVLRRLGSKAVATVVGMRSEDGSWCGKAVYAVAVEVSTTREVRKVQAAKLRGTNTKDRHGRLGKIA